MGGFPAGVNVPKELKLKELERVTFENIMISEYTQRARDIRPNLTEKDINFLVKGVPGNYFSYTGFVRWMDQTLPLLTTEVMKEVRADEFFHLREYHPDEHQYVPLAQREDMSYPQAIAFITAGERRR